LSDDEEELNSLIEIPDI